MFCDWKWILMRFTDQQPCSLCAGQPSSPDCTPAERSRRVPESQDLKAHSMAPSSTQFAYKDQNNQDIDASKLRVWASPRRATLSCARLLQLRAVEACIPNEFPANTAQVVESAEPILAVSVHSGAVDTDVQKI
ncbi:hypothetical protein OH76DRAFT_67166 [Lentinus brumalis]|uniref:Uncharacterized protein n=1 Tax=Lentinus brumalis TaxID=2498619 RepID=A0A371DKL7_9APHY|nr:hypothetical protein OH76DRAFT_67166 [Polyporus brumalis]